MRLRKEIAKYHTVVFTLVKKPGVPPRRMNVLYLLAEEGPQPLLPFVDYVIETGHGSSLSWQRTAARSIGLFIDFLTANAETLRTSGHLPKPLALFAEALAYGTIDIEGKDTSGLFWEPKNRNVVRLTLNTVNEFGDWLANRFGMARINPWRNSTVAEQIAFWRANDQRRGHQLLGYTNSAATLRHRAATARSVVVAGNDSTFTLQAPKIFPRDRFGDLLFKGFIRPDKQHETDIHERLNIRNCLISILLHGGGLRESEPFHLYVSDVSINPRNPNGALVKLFHPVDGRAPADFVDPISSNQIVGTREQYLRQKYQLEPRNLVAGRFRAGWKRLLLSNTRDRCAYVYWFPEFWGEVFLSLFRIYITKCRSRHSRHPFLFVSEKEDVEGEPYSISSFRQAHARAVERIGLAPLKENGTTPHGHRHACGQNLADAGIDPLIIREVLHHTNLHSQEIYTAAPSAKVIQALAVAEKTLHEKLLAQGVAEALVLNGIKLAA